MSQLNLFLARTLWRSRAFTFFILPLALLTASGCKSAHPKQRDSTPKIAKTETDKEPSLMANVAVKAEPENESDTVKSVVSNGRSKSKLTRSRIRPNPSSAQLSGTTVPGDASGLEGTNLDLVSDIGNSDSSLDRLNAALSDDAAQVQMLPQHSLTTLEARIRVDLLISRSRQLAEIGQLEQALQSANLAQELGESAQLDYSPDEDRPIDLVRRIEGQLEIQRLADQATPKEDQTAPNENLADDNMSIPDPDLSEDKSKPAAQETEKPRMARIRRELSTLFRREKKSTTTENEATVRDSKPGSAALNLEPAIEDQQTNRTTSQPSRDGIVVANRSVAIGNAESAKASMTSFAPDLTDEPPSEPAVSRSSRTEPLIRAESDQFDDRDHPDTNAGFTSDSGILRPKIDDSLAPQPEFEVGEPLGPSREIEIGNEVTPRVAFKEPEEDVRQSDWSTFYIFFGICGLFAIVCYRRGTT